MSPPILHPASNYDRRAQLQCSSLISFSIVFILLGVHRILIICGVGKRVFACRESFVQVVIAVAQKYVGGSLYQVSICASFSARSYCKSWKVLSRR